MSSHDASSEVPSLAVVGIDVFGNTLHLDKDTEYSHPRILPRMSCRNTHRSPFGQIAAAIEVLFKTVDAKPCATVDEL